MTTHPTEYELHDFIDGDIELAPAAAITRHLAECDACRTAVERGRRLQQQLRALPRDSAPPDDALHHIHERIAQAGPRARDGAVAHAATHSAGAAATPARPAWAGRGVLAAAALALIALSSTVTAALVLRYGPARGVVRDDGVLPAEAGELTALGILESSYIDTITELERVLREQEHVLAPETVRLIRTNLDIVDRALGEARAALRDDPANAALVDLLRANYERKLDVLRSASAYAATRL